jgi:uncharacterized protein (UPF0276 family)
VRLVRLGLGWRNELAPGILANLDRIGVLEVLAEELFDADASRRRAMRFLAREMPVVLHATSLGLASTERVDRKRLDKIARVVDWLQPELWSEHLAFVRAGNREIGHLAAPPRNDATLEGLVRNVEEARRVTGSLPLVENVASLIEPPLCTYSEAEWLHAVLAATECGLLLDLHNVYANAMNFGFDAAAAVASLPADRIGMVHIAGGRVIERGRVLDDHLHAVPREVVELLALVPVDATVVLERDGNYPTIEELLEELWSAAAQGAAFKRAERAPALPLRHTKAVAPPALPPATALLNLAELYTDADARERFLANPTGPLADINPDDLRLAARSFEHKRKRSHLVHEVRAER